ncbi:Glycosyltransferase involved in cell wall bisynthesis [Variovorax sp. HW608]|uniref:glycosyltransferase family 4 protein n=1 Tax=Variovorax sp. HW608 TaxID=1034889 RepID=UPI00081F93D9|nr:glycosyltransferase family 4 protein [Variovorax sp. HW608]SCK37762.1 Glycosyltransferase involved in cell wall bisynthesis [Variovorax sp. HW608]
MSAIAPQPTQMDADPLSESTYRDLRQRLAANAREVAQRLDLDWNAVMQPGADRHTPAKQALVLLELGLFDQEYYLSSYPDIVAAGFEPIAHYINLGDAEGRKPNPVFDPDFYRSQFDRGEPGSVTALYHYAVIGEALGLKASSSFSPRRYLQSNSELQPWLDRPLTHYVNLGRKIGLMVNHRARLSDAQKVRFEREDLPPPQKRVDPARGLNVIGPLDRVSGLGVSARGYLDGLRRAGLTRLGCRAQQREFAIQSSIEGTPEFPAYLDDGDVNLVHMNGDTLPVMVAHGGDELFRDKYNIAVWYWELPTLRPEWQVSMKYFHEFWAPTPFIYRMLRQSTAKPVHLLPPYLAYLTGLERHHASESGETTFVYCFDANSILERKNPSALLDAFLQAFPKGSSAKVRLTFKITYPNRKVPEVDYLYQTAEKDSRIKIIDHLLTDAELHSLISGASAYVSPHRSEGLGLTVIEAMGAGVPVISTAFGGVDAFVNAESAYPVDYRLIELEDDYIPYPRGFVWADPDVASIAAQLLEVYRNPAEADRRAAVAQKMVLDYFCSDELIGRYAAELQRISRG